MTAASWEKKPGWVSTEGVLLMVSVKADGEVTIHADPCLGAAGTMSILRQIASQMDLQDSDMPAGPPQPAYDVEDEVSNILRRITRAAGTD